MLPDTSIRLEGAVALLGGAEHPHAVRRLRQEWPALDLFDAASAPDGTPALRLATDVARPEGGFALAVDPGPGAPLIDVAGGPFSGVIYGVEELVQRRAARVGNGVEVAIGRVEQAPGLAYRAFWNWDHSTNWDLDADRRPGDRRHQPLRQTARRASWPTSSAMVDFMSCHRIAAITIYGFLRDSHGGIEAAQELCRTPTSAASASCPGVAINAYGGVVWEMDHHYNLATWLRNHPELAADMERPAGFQIRDLDFPLFFPRERLQRPRLSLAAREPALDGGGHRLAGRDLRDRRDQHRGRRLRRLRLRRVRRPPGRARGRGPPRGYAESWSHADMADFFPRL